jgi:hypothetical protein
MEISELLSQPHDMNPGSAAPYLESFAAQMASVGHTSLTIGFYLGSAVHFGGWLEARGLDFADINEDTIKAFGTPNQPFMSWARAVAKGCFPCGKRQ